MNKDFFELYNLILEEKPQKSDVIVWLQGDRYDRLSKVKYLYEKGWALKILISGNNVLLDSKSRPGENNISIEEMYRRLITEGVKKEDIFTDDKAMNTKEQSENIIDLAKVEKWQRIILVGSSFYQPRAFLTFLKQAKKIDWRGEIINQPVFLDLEDIPGGQDKKVKRIIKDEINKIKKYKDDLIDIKEGLRYLEKRKV